MGRGFGAIPPIATSFSLNAVSAVAYLGLAVVIGSAGASLAVPTGSAIMLVLIGGTIGAALPTLAYVIGVRLTGSARAAILMMFEAVVGATLAAVFLDQRPELIQLVGGAAVLGAGAVLQLPRPRMRSRAERCLRPTVQEP